SSPPSVAPSPDEASFEVASSDDASSEDPSSDDASPDDPLDDPLPDPLPEEAPLEPPEDPPLDDPLLEVPPSRPAPPDEPPLDPPDDEPAPLEELVSPLFDESSLPHPMHADPKTPTRRAARRTRLRSRRPIWLFSWQLARGRLSDERAVVQVLTTRA